ncbi:MAG TPA: lipid-binding SYLF domain-containing protein [Gammaproteobacteria bacterium]|jgi:lipid-binding SYLF domain-containing protein|nr:lipid-binding SYLF domain-containing protein [Gammaproteobacteria bacterium]
MQFRKLGAVASAAVLAASCGIASAQQSGNQNASNNASANGNSSYSITPAELTETAYSAAGILHGLMLRSADKQIPQTFVNHARCIAVFPTVFKEGLIVAGSHGDGIVSCRDMAGNWQAPVFFDLSGGSVGLQAGAKVSNLIVLFMNKNAAQQLMDGNVDFGAKAAVAAGPIGLHARAHTAPAPMLAYEVNSSGGFAGAEVKGTRISIDQPAMNKLYGKNAKAQQVLFHRSKAPEHVRIYNEALQAFAPQTAFVKNEIQVKSQTAK